jgi:hypothetical protein
MSNGGNGLNNLFIPYTTGDNGSRPFPAGTDFWQSPDVILDTSNGAAAPDQYTIGVPNGIVVSVTNNSLVAYQTITVQVWVCDPSTVTDVELPPFQGATVMQETLTGEAAPAAPTVPGSVTTIRVSGFVPYPGMSSLPGGHCCLIANCFGQTADGTFDGQDATANPAFNRVTEVQSDPHVAQHNIFAAAPTGEGQQRRLSFPFMAVTPIRKGREEVVLEIQHLTGTNALTADDLALLKKGPFKHLPLHISKVPIVDTFEVHGCHHGPGRIVKQELHAGKPLPLSIELELRHTEAIGGVHSFDVIQKAATGQVQGGLRLLVVIDH